MQDPGGGSAGPAWPGVVKADIPALLQTADHLDVVATDMGEIGGALTAVPTASEAAYGWVGTSNAMNAMTSSWIAEAKTLQQAMNEMTTMVRVVVENLRWADDRARNRTGMHGL